MRRPVALISIGLLAAIAGLLLPRTAAADNSLKRKVFKDCPAAITAAQSLIGTDRTELADYARRVISLEAMNPADEDIDPYIAAVTRRPTDPGGGPLYSSEVARTLDPREEIEARQCAAQILTYLLPESIAALPELLRLASDKSQAEEVKTALTDAARTIAAKWITLSDQTLPVETARQLVALIDQVPEKLAADVILAFGSQTIGLIYDELSNAPPERREKIFTMLALRTGLDPEVTAVILTVLSSTDPDLRRRGAVLIGHLAQFDRKLFGAVLQLADDSADDVRSAADTAVGRQLANIADPSQIDDPATIDKLVAIMPRSSADTKAAISATLVHSAAQLVEKNKAALTAYLNSTDSTLVLESAGVLSAAGPLPKAAFIRVVELLFSKNPEMEQAALILLAHQTDRSEEALAAISRFLKLNGSETSADRSLQRTVWAAEAVKSGKFGAKAKYLVPYFTDALVRLSAQADPQQSAEDLRGKQIAALVEAVISVGSDAESDVTKMLAKSPQALPAAVRIFDGLPKLGASAMDGLIARLSTAADADRRTLFDVIKKHGANSPEAIRSGLKSQNKSVALDCAEIALDLKLYESQAAETASKNLTAMNCEQFDRLKGRLTSVKDQQAIKAKADSCSVDKQPPAAPAESLPAPEGAAPQSGPATAG